MRNTIASIAPSVLVGFAACLLAFGAPSAQADHNGVAHFVTRCYEQSDPGGYFDTQPVTRDTARLYATTARMDGYQWGGGCWNDNDVVENRSNSDPGEQSWTGGEGPDCSGFVYKSWYLRFDMTSGFRYHKEMQNTHGPLATYGYMDEAQNGTGTYLYGKPGLSYMDSLVSGPHMGMIYSEGTTYGTDQIIEAKCELCGTDIWSRDYRDDPDYVGLRRQGWYAGPPTSVAKSVLLAFSHPQGIRLEWTASGFGDILAFNLYRSADRGEARRVSRRPISAAETGGSRYRYIDRGARLGVSYEYRLQIMRGDGSAISAGRPISAVRK